MTAPARSRGRGRHARPANDSERVLLRLIPCDRWVTTVQIAEAAWEAGVPVETAPGQQLMLGGRPLDNVLRDLRRHGWALYDRHSTPHAWRRTPTGTVQTEAAH